MRDMAETIRRRTGLAVAMLMAGTAAQAAGASGDTIGPVTFRCDDGSAIEATFDNAPDPATVQLVRGDRQVTLPQAISADGARYVGSGIEFWNKGRDAMVDWQGQKFTCSEAE